MPIIRTFVVNLSAAAAVTGYRQYYQVMSIRINNPGRASNAIGNQ